MTDVLPVGFAQLKLDERILRAIEEMGFEEPTPIQAQAIPPMLQGRDLLGQAHTGTGKTAAFSIPVLQQSLSQGRGPSALVLTPTRELAIQVAEEITRVGRYLPVRVVPVYGGQPIERQIRAIRRGVGIVVGTPGRVLDHLHRGTLHFDEVRVVVVDEADEMLNMGFIDDLDAILQSTPPARQTLLFSATLPGPIVRLASQHMKNPVRITARAEHVSSPDIEQLYYEVRPYERVEALCRILDTETVDRAIVFCRTKRGVDELTGHLKARGFVAEAIHGDLDQRQRDRVMQSFRHGSIDLLVATDVAARGLDVENVTHVINFDLPSDPESYVHRIGRTGRAGKSGTAITLISPREGRIIRVIEQATRARLKRRLVPTQADVTERQHAVWRDRLAKTAREANLAPFRGIIEELTAEFDSLDVGAAALKLLLERPAPVAPAPVAPPPQFPALRERAGRQRQEYRRRSRGAWPRREWRPV